MNRLTTLFGKPLLTKDGRKIGTVEKVQLDKSLKTLKNLGYIVDDKIEYIPYTAIASIGKDAIVLKSVSIAAYKNCITISMGMPIYNVQGEYVGSLQDFATEKYTILYAILEEDRQLPLSHFIGITDIVMIDSTQQERKQLHPKQTVRKRENKKKTPPQKTTLSAEDVTEIQDTPSIEDITKIKDTTSTEEVAEINATNSDDITEKVEVYEELIQANDSTRMQEIAQEDIPPIENNTAQIVIQPKMEYISNTGNAIVIGGKSTPLSSIHGKPLQEIYASKKFLQQSNKEVGTTVLTGKRMLDDLLDDQGKILIERYTVISAEHIKKAIEHNKLFQLIQLVHIF